MQVEMAYGRDGLWVELPDDRTVMVIEPRFIPGLPDEREAILKALRSPLNTRPLNESVNLRDRVAIVFSDLTRPMPNDRVLPLVLDELARIGLPRDQIVLINALGTHRTQTETELRQMLGDQVVERYQIVQHDAWSDDLVPVAKNTMGHTVSVNRAYMEASVRILTGLIEPHFFAGFSGGPKAVLPGIADIDSILDNHSGSMLADPRATWAVTEAQDDRTEIGNPLWNEMFVIAQATDPAFLLNVTLNQKREITGVFAGHMATAHREGVAFARETAMQPVEEVFDVVITSNSGYPLDLNLYQAVKGMSAAAQIVRPGGDIIVVAECWDGIPDHGEYKAMLWEADSPEDLWQMVTASGFRRRDQWEALLQARIQRKANVHVYADGLTEDELKQALVISCRSVEETVERLLDQNPETTIAVLPDGPQTVPYLRQEA